MFVIEKKIIMNFFNYAQRVNEECIIRIDENEWHIRVMDPSDISLIDISMKKENFNEYHLNFDNYNDTELKIAVNVEDIYKGIKKLGDPVVINIDESKICVGDANNTVFGFLLLNTDLYRDDWKLPDIYHPLSFKMDGILLKKIIKNAKDVGDYVKIETIDSNKIEFSSSNLEDMEAKYRTVLERDRGIKEIDYKERGKAILSLGYLYPVSRAFGKKSIVETHIGINVPVKLCIEDMGIYIEYFLAPVKIEDEKKYTVPPMDFNKLKTMKRIKTIKKFIENYRGCYHYSYKIPIEILNILKYEERKFLENVGKEINGYLVIYQ